MNMRASSHTDHTIGVLHGYEAISAHMQLIHKSKGIHACIKVHMHAFSMEGSAYKHCHAYVIILTSLASKGQKYQLTRPSAPVGIGGEGEEVGEGGPGRDEAVAVDGVHDGHRVTPHARAQRVPWVLAGAQPRLWGRCVRRQAQHQIPVRLWSADGHHIFLQMIAFPASGKDMLLMCLHVVQFLGV